MKDVFDCVEAEDLTPDLEMVANVCGIEFVRNLLRNLSGLSFYVPKLSRLESFIGKYMRNNKEKNLKQVAKELLVSEQFLKKLIKDKRIKV